MIKTLEKYKIEGVNRYTKVSDKAIKQYLPSYFKDKSINKGGGNHSQNDMEKLLSVYKILDSVIESSDEVLLKIMLEAYERDIDMLFNDVIKTTYKVLYGQDTHNLIKPEISYLKEMDGLLNEQLRISSCSYFCSDVLGMEINWHHLEWNWLIENFLLLAILAARDHGKSFFFSHGYPLWKMYRYDRLKKDVSILNGRLGYIFSNTVPQSVNLLEIIRDSIEEHPELKDRLYPTVNRDEWSKTSIKTKNGCRLRVRGMNSTVRGAHPTYVVADDVLKDNVLYSKTQRERSIDYFTSVILNLVVPGGQLIVVGTPFHVKDLYSIFRDGIDFAYRVYPAIDDNGNLLWPNRYNKRDLESKKRLMGEIRFSREMLVKPISDSSSMFPEKALSTSIKGMQNISYINNIEESNIKFRKIVTAGDFSKSANVGADFNSFVTFGIDDTETMYLLNIHHSKGLSFNEQKRVLRQIWRNFKPDLIFLEANQFQSIYAETLAEETSMPVKPFVTTRVKNSLEKGVPSLSILFENGKMKFPYKTDRDKETTEKVLDEFRNIGWTDKGIKGIGEHDDIVMSIWIARMAVLSGIKDFLVDFID